MKMAQLKRKTNNFEQLAIILRRSKSSNQMARKQESFTRNTLRNTNLKMCQNFAKHILWFSIKKRKCQRPSEFVVSIVKEMSNRYS